MSQKSKSTMVEFVEELRKLPQSPLIEMMIKEALAGEFHDYKNKKYPCGKVQAVNYLISGGHTDLARRVVDGEFDETADAEDIEHMRSYTPKQLWSALGLDKDQTKGDLI